MKRIQEKVKDIVQVENHQSLRDFMADPANTLASYHFTDGTADLMSKWIDKVATVSNGSGAAFALAGYRGVGKSHFLAALGAIVSLPDLRDRIADPHVSASAQRLSRKHYPIAYVRRGSEESLLVELKEAIAKACGVSPASVPDSPEELIELASKKAGELPFILMVDTALERGSRVSRDDGELLGRLAKAAASKNIFIGVALDDDIAGADGLNAAIAQTYSIEYLDQEHLYKVVNSFIFPKNHQMMPVLHDVHRYFQEVIPSFRWSEQRFTSLYPLHPITLEIAPFIRLYVHEFALLAFASGAGNRILGRPANSLIALDEVFDSVESELRKIEDLRDAFAAYDKLNDGIVAEIPVMQRLQAKLILKALLLLSLAGEGTTANEISAAMLIFDEEEPQKAVANIENLIKRFAEELPEDVQIIRQEGREDRYGFKLASKEDLNRALSEAAADVSAEIAPRTIRRLFFERFADTRATEPDAVPADAIETSIFWRGGERRGRIHFPADGTALDITAADPERYDWEVFIDLLHTAPDPLPKLDKRSIVWRADAVRPDEIEAIRRFHALSAKPELREEYGDQIAAAIQSHAHAAEKTAKRVLLENGKFIIDGFDYNLTDNALASDSISGLLAEMLEPLFATSFPEHPQFAAKLGSEEVAALVAGLYNGNRENLPEIQKLAGDFAEPLGLVTLQDNVFAAKSDDQLMKLPLAAEIMKLVPPGGESVPMKTMYARLRQEPYGLVREAQHLLLSALVAARQIEFVTSKGDRINRRSLDLTIIWDDVVAVALPAETAYSSKKLLRWASIMSGAEFANINGQAERAKLMETFGAWLAKWKESAILDRFNEIPDEVLNTRIWRISSRLTKTYGAAAEAVEALLAESISLDECLNRIADAFSDSEAEYKQCSAELIVLEDFIKGVSVREQVRTYLALCEPAEDQEIEALRESLAKITETSYFYPSETHNREMGYAWDKFRKVFAEYFAGHHDIIMRSQYLHEKFENIKRSDKWWEFENLSGIQLFEPTYWIAAKKIIRELRQLNCKADVRKMLVEQPFCVCPFSLTKLNYWEKLPQNLRSIVDQGLKYYRDRLIESADEIVPMLERFGVGSSEPEVKEAVLMLTTNIKSGSISQPFTTAEIQILQKVLERFGKPDVERFSTFDVPEQTAGDDLDEVFGSWIEEQPNEEFLLNI